MKEGKLSKKNIQLIDNTLYKNICYLNSTRIKVNNESCNRFIKDKEYITVDFKYNDKKESYRVCEGMPIIACQKYDFMENCFIAKFFFFPLT